MNEEKRKALESAFGQIEKEFGSGAVMRLGEKPAMNIQAIPNNGCFTYCGRGPEKWRCGCIH